MCKDTCNKCNECNPCDRKCNQQDCGCKFEVDAMCVRYTKNDLECSGLPKGTILEDIIEAFDRKLCETGDVNQVIVAGGDNVTVDTSVDGNTTTYTVNAEASGGNTCNNLYLSLNPLPSANYYKIPEIVLTGGTAPYTYKWSLQQTGGTTFVIGDTTTSSYDVMKASLTLATSDNCNGAMVSTPPCRVSLANINTDPIHAWHFKLEVTDANGCKVKDYWTHYEVIFL